MLNEGKRALAYVAKIGSIKPIEKADKIECASVNGWSVVVPRDVYHTGDMVLFIEVDAMVPASLVPFLAKDGEQFVRIKTRKMRGQVSQGLIMELPTGISPEENTDLTSMLNIKLYEEEPNENGYESFPTHLFPKTSAERLQNIDAKEWAEMYADDEWEITRKMDGSSMTVAFHDRDVYVCSRNFVVNNANNQYTHVFNQSGLMNMRKHGNVAIQGELVGPKIQNNREAKTFPHLLNEQWFYVFGVYSIDQQCYIPNYRNMFENESLHNVAIVPLHGVEKFSKEDWETGSIARILAEKGYLKADSEGVVVRNKRKPDVLFKVVNAEYLLKHDL